MTRGQRLGALLVTALVGAEAPARERPPVEVTADERALVDATTAFALDLYRVAGEGGENLVLSPHSIAVALAMTWAGARGATADELARALHVELPADRAHAAFGKLLAREAPAGVTLNQANGLWVQRGKGLEAGFLSLLAERYVAEPREADFVGAAEEERAAINEWVEEKTAGIIRDLLPPGSIDPLTRLVLANAVQFKGTWAEPFPAEATKEAPFRLAGGGTTPVRLMRLKSEVPYAEGPGWQIVELPYEGTEASMLVVLPAEPDGLPALEAELSPARLAGWIGSLARKEVDVRLPRFEVRASLGLIDPSRRLGVHDLFNADTADLSGIDGGAEELYVTAAVHQAFVHVDEEGTEAAAVTGVVAGTRAMPSRPPVFLADRPFLFLLRDRRTGSVLFLGRLAHPQA